MSTSRPFWQRLFSQSKKSRPDVAGADPRNVFSTQQAATGLTADGHFANTSFDNQQEGFPTSDRSNLEIYRDSKTASPINITSTETMNSIKTKVLIISDTHCCELKPANDLSHIFRNPLPRAEVLLHCGDLTHNGGLDQYRVTLQMLKSIDAELKLVIAGNHDKTLDGEYWQRKRSNMSEWQDHPDAVEMWCGAEARDAGVIYLEEGVHQFTLKSGAMFKIYASPYTPEFCGWAFPYGRNQDRFNPPDLSEDFVPNISVNPIPDFPDVDIIMTHGPPEGVLDLTTLGTHAGCRHLLRALHRAKPMIHCFGHIHEGWGAQVINWAKYEDDLASVKRIEKVQAIHVDGPEMFENRAMHVNISNTSKTPLRRGNQTLMVNAAIMNERSRPMNGPWLVALDLPRAQKISEA